MGRDGIKCTSKLKMKTNTKLQRQYPIEISKGKKMKSSTELQVSGTMTFKAL
jgi:hypothetical protein